MEQPIPPVSKNGKTTLESVERVMAILSAFTPQSPELRLTDLSRITGIPKPQALRIASTLEGGRFLIRDRDSKRYRLGPRVFQLGMIFLEQEDLRKAAQPSLLKLAEQTQETVSLVLPDDVGPICLEVIESPRSLRVYAQPGRRMPWNAGSTGKVILAYLSDGEREAILRAAHFEKYTSRTPTEPNQLRPLLLQIRQDGFHIAAMDLDEGAVGVAAPIFDHTGTIAGAISVSGPVSRIMGDAESRIVALVCETCEEVSYQLGYSKSSVHR